jgi:hypothetical protein
MINQNPDNSRQGEIGDDVLNQGLELIKSGSLRYASEEPALPEGPQGGYLSHEPTPDEVWEYMATNRTRTFDKSTEQGRRMYELFKVANKERNQWTMDVVKQMVNTIAAVPANLVNSLIDNPLKAPVSILDGVARDVRDLYGILAQSEDPNSPLFRFKAYITGNGTIEEEIDQFNEARWFNNKSQELEEGVGTVLEDFVPEDKREFVKSLIDPKMAQALSYIGLDLPHLLLSPFKARRAIGTALNAYKDPAMIAKAMGEQSSVIREGLDLATSRGKNFANKAIGTAMSGVADAVGTPFRVIEEKARRIGSAVAETSGQNPTVLRNATSTVLADAGEKVIGEVGAMSPLRTTLFSFGVKPLTEYASVLGSEIVDAAQGVAAVKPQNMGMGMLERLATKNGSRIPLSTEALAVAKFTNVVVGWPASMAIPVFKRAVGDAAVMGTLGYLNARGEGAAGGVGVGFAWGGLSGSLRHVHSVYEHSLTQRNLIDNFDKAQINQIASVKPDNARNFAEATTVIDRLKDDRVSSTVRAFMSMLHTADPSVEFRFASVDDAVKEFGVQGPNNRVMIGGVSYETLISANAKGMQFSSTLPDGTERKVVWINKNFAQPETIGHEIAHQILDHVFSLDNDNGQIVRQFFGETKDSGVVSDKAMAYLMADYTANYYGLNKTDGDKRAAVESLASIYSREIDTFRSQIDAGTLNWDNLKEINDQGGSMFGVNGVPIGRTLKLGKIVQEFFAYNVSNQLLGKSPDFFLRNPEGVSLKSHVENLYTLMNQRVVSRAEEAGLIINHVKNAESGKTSFETFMWQDGHYRRFEMLDNWSEGIMRKAMRHGDVNVSLMSPERAKAFFEANNKVRFSNVINGGRVMKDKKEVDQLISENAEQMVKTWEAMPPDKRPKFIRDQGGNVTVDLTNVGKEAWDSLNGKVNMTKAELDELKGICEVIRDNRAGKPVFNTFSGQYLGRTHQVEAGGLVKRLTGKDVPVTYRRFSPFSAELKFDKFDENGNPIRNPKGHVTLHVVDVAVIDRRRMKMWQRADTRSIFTDFGHFTRTFTTYMHNLSQATGIKLPSEKLFAKEFGSQAGRVRDLMYETFGGRKRVDESFINVPSDGYTGNKDGPNYPFHSLRFELLAGLQRQTRVFAETFGNGLGNLPYNHVEAYDGVRRNLMVGGFRVHELDNDRNFWSNGAGFEIRGDAGRFRLFSPYGNSVGVFKTPEKAIAAADKHAKKLDPADFTPTSGNEGLTIDGDTDITPTIAASINGSTNLMVSGGRIYNMGIQKDNNYELSKFKNAVAGFSDVSGPVQQNYSGTLNRTFLSKMGAPTITLGELCGSKANNKNHILYKYPQLKELVMYCSLGSPLNGDIDVQFGVGRQTMDAVGISKALASHKNFERIIEAELAPHLQSWVSAMEGELPAHMLAFNFTGKGLESELMGVGQFSNLNREFLAYKASGNPNATFKDFLGDVASKKANDVAYEYINGTKLSQAEQQRLNLNTPTWGAGGNYVKTIWVMGGDDYGIGARGRNKIVIKKDKNGRILYSLDDPQQKAVNDFFLKIVQSFTGTNPSSYSMNVMGRNVYLVDPKVVDLNTLGSVFKQLDAVNAGDGANLKEAIVRELQNAEGFLHAISKDPSRRVKSKGVFDQGAADSNRSMMKLGFTQNAVVLDKDAQGIPAQWKGEADIPKQVALLADGIGDYSILQLQGGSDKALQTTSELIIHSKFIPITVKNILSATSDTKSLMSQVQAIAGKFPYKSGETIMSVNMSMAMLRQSPFLDYDYGTKNYVGTGSLHDAYANGLHVMLLQSVAQDLLPNLSQNDLAQLATTQGAEKFVRATFDMEQNGKTYFARQIGMAVQQILTGTDVISGNGQSLANVAMVMGNIADDANLTQFMSNPATLGPTMVNAGYAKLMKVAMFADTSVMKNAFKSNLFQNDKSSKFNKFTNALGTLTKNTLEVSGVKLHEPRTSVRGGYGTSPNPQLMVGGYQNSTNARMQEMVDLGMARRVRTDGGKIYHAFEFTDADSQLKLESARGELHLLPLLGGYGLDDTATEGLDNVANRFFDEYLKARASNDKSAMDQIVSRLSYIKLSDILDHKLLYNFYPNLKNVMVGFQTGYDASYAPNLNKITIGIDRLIGDEVNKRTDSNKIPTSIFEDGPDRGTRALLLHEIQHSIQKVEGWTDAYSVNNLEDFNIGAIRFLVGEVMGNKEAVGVSRDVLSNKDLDYLEKYFGPDAKIGTKTPLEVLNAVRRLIDSPMHKQISAFALPAVMRVVGQMVLAVSDAYGEMAESHPERKKAEAVVRDLENIHRKVNQYNQMIKDGTASPSNVYVALTKRGGIIEAIGDMQNRSYSLGDSPIAKALFNDISYANRYLSESLSLLQQNESLKILTSGDTNGQMLALRQIADTLSNMHYHGMRNEIEANMTERRSKMSQAELNKSGLSPSGERISGIEGFEGPLDVGVGGNSLRKLGLAIAEKKSVRSLMFGQNPNLMVGGLGLGVSAFDATRQGGITDSLRVLETLGRLATVSHSISAINDDLSALNIYGFTSRGWEVDAETGKIALVYKKGMMKSAKDFNAEDASERNLRDRMRQGIDAGTGTMSIASDDNRFQVVNALDKENKGTLNIEQLASLLDAKIDLMETIETPVEAINIVMDDPNFPPVILADDLVSYLNSRGVSQDGISLSNADSISKVFVGQNLTKAELVNIMSFFHQQLVDEITYGGKESFIAKATEKAMSIINREEGLTMTEALSVLTSGFAGSEESTATSILSSHSDSSGNFYTHSDKDVNSKQLGLFKAKRGVLRFDLDKPTFVSQADWDIWVNERLGRTKYLKKEKGGNYYITGETIGEGDVRTNNNNTADLSAAAQQLNRRLARKLVLLKPFLDGMTRYFRSAEFSGLPQRTKRTALFSLLDEMYKDSITINPYSESSGEMNRSQIKRAQNDSDTFGSSGFSENVSKLLYPDEATVPDSIAKHGKTLTRFGTETLSRSVIGTSADPNSILFNTRSILSPIVGLTSDRNLGYRSYRDVAPEVHKANLGQIIHKVFYYNDEFFGQVMGVPYDLSQLYQNHVVTSSYLNAWGTYLSSEMQTYDLEPMPVESMAEIVKKVYSLSALAGELEMRHVLSLQNISPRSNPITIDYSRRSKQFKDAREKTSFEGQQVYKDAVSLDASVVSATNGYVSKAGEVVITDSRLAQSLAANQVGKIESIPIPVAGKATPIELVRKAERVGAMVHFEDMKLRDYLFGTVYGDGRVLRSGTSVVSKLLEVRNAFASDANLKKISPQRRDKSAMMWNGTHALHSSMYFSAVINGIDKSALTRAVSNTPLLIDILQNHNKYALPFDAHTVNAALAPFVLTAMAEKQAYIYQGKVMEGDFLLPDQRSKFNEILSGESNSTLPAFWVTLENWQKNHILGYFNNNNVVHTFDNLVGAMSAKTIIERLKTAEAGSLTAMDALYANAGGFVKAMENALDTYLSHDAFWWETGVQGGAPFLDTTEGNYGINRIHDNLTLFFTNSGAAGPHVTNGEIAGFVNALNGVQAFDHVETTSTNGLTIPYTEATGGEIRGSGRRFVFGQNVQTNEGLGLVKQSGFFGNGTPFINLGDQINAGDEIIFPKTAGVSSARSILDNKNNYESFVTRSPQFKLVSSDKGGIAAQILAGRQELTKSGISTLLEDQPSTGVNLREHKFSKRGVGLTSAFMRKQMVDGIIREARRAKKESAVIEPARYKLSGRVKPNLHIMATETDNQKSVFLSELAIYGATSISNLPFTNTHGYQSVDDSRLPMYSAPFGHKPSYGFAFKKLSDGSTVVNVSGDHFAHKYMLKASRKGVYQNKTYFGFNVQEGLGYNPNNGLMTPSAFQGVSMGMKKSVDGIPDAVLAYAQFGGSAWVDEIIKTADHTLANGLSETRIENNVIAGAGDVVIQGGHKQALLDGTFAGSENKLIPAYEMARNGIGHNYMTFTFPPNTIPEVIKGTLMVLFASNASAELARISSTVHGGYTLSYFGRGADGSSGISKAQLDYIKSGGGRSLNSENSVIAANSMNTLFKETLNQATQKTTSSSNPLQDIWAPFNLMNQSELNGHLDTLMGMIVGKDHGYFLPQSEKQLIASGDTKVAIESMFPNRPDLLDYAWDNESTGDVSIVEQKDKKKKVTGYLVGYNIQTGYDEAGNKTHARRVVSARTRSEAEAIKLKFTVSTSKAELAMAIERISNNGGQAIKLNALDSGNVVFNPMTNRVASLGSDGVLAYKKGDTQTVGHTDKPMSSQMAEAIANTLAQNQGLSVNIGQPTANLMVGNRNSKDLEASLRRRIQFGSGLGPIEFSSTLMTAIAYGKLKGKPEHLAYPATLTGNEWFKFLKESKVSKDEFRQTGLITLLHANKDQQISRQELAEFVHTTYPSTYRISRHTNPIIVESDASTFRLPWGEDIATKENQVVNDLSLNLIIIGDAIDSAIKPDTTPEAIAEIELLKNSMMAALDTLIKEADLPASIKERSTMAGMFESLKEEIEKQISSDNQDSVIKFGSQRTIRPMQLNYLYKTFIESRMESLNTMALDYFGGHDGLQIEDPYSYRKMDTFMRDPAANEQLFSGVIAGNYNPMGPYTRNTWDLGLMMKVNQNNHNSYATAYGQYTSSVMQSEIMGSKTKIMFESFRSELEERIKKTDNPEDIRRIRSIQASLDRVRDARIAINSNNQFNDASHYSGNPDSTFQLGHLRETISIKNAELGLFTLGDKKFIGGDKLFDPVSGVQGSIEPVIVIEEIQSDTMQRYEVSAAGKAEMALPDTFEQVEGILRAGDLAKVSDEIRKMETLLQNNEQCVKTQIGTLSQGENFGTKFDVVFNRNLAKSLLNPFEIYSLYRAYYESVVDSHNEETTSQFKEVFVNTGRTVKPSGNFAFMAETTPEIPVYELDFDALDRICEKIAEAEGNLYNVNQLLYKVMSVIGSETSAILAKTIKANTPSLLHGVNRVGYSGMKIVGSIVPVVGMIDEVASSMGKMANNINEAVASDLVDYDMVGSKVINWVRDRIAFLESGNAIDGEEIPSRIQHKALMALADTLEQMGKESPNAYFIPVLDISSESIKRKDGQMSIGESMGNTDSGFPKISQKNYERTLFKENGDPIIAGKRSDNQYQILKTNARSALGVAVAHAVRPWAVRGSIDVLPAQIKELKVKQAELAKMVPINPSKGDSSIINTSMPFGVEDIYKPVSLNATIIRAAAKGMNSIILSDARHMFNRGYSPNESQRSPYMILGRRRRLFAIPDAMKPLASTLAHMSMFENSSGVYGNLVGRLKEMPDVELEQILAGGKFAHEGNSITLYHHLGKLAGQFLDLVYANGTPEYNSVFTLESVYNREAEVTGGFVFRREASDTLGTAMTDENGKPINPSKVDEESLIGRMFAREKRRVQQAFKSMGSFALLTENGDCMGYVSNYGLPSYWLEGHFAGAERSLIDFYATDAFDMPVLDYQADTGTYNIVDAKTGKLIKATKNKEEALEVFHQSKKYRGSNGYIGNFLKNWSGLGGYVGTGFYAGQSSSNGVGEMMDITDASDIRSVLRNPILPKELSITRSDAGGQEISPEKSRSLAADQRQARPDKPVYANNPINSKYRKLQYMARGLMTNKQVIEYENMIASASGTMMRFKPKFPTEAHKIAWRKRAIEGLANLMPSNTPDYRPMPTAGNLDLLKRISEFRRAPIENQDDESETSR